MDRIQHIRDLITQNGFNGYIIPSTDEWQNKYTSSNKRRLEFISGFSGSNGVLIITTKDLILYTDSRYMAQAKVELSEEYTIVDMYQRSSCSVIKACEGCIIGYDPMILTQSEVEYYEKLGKKYNFTLIAFDENLVDMLIVDNSVEIVEISGDEASMLCSKIIDVLPAYFGIHEVNETYINTVKSKHNFAAKIDQKYSGMISIEYNHRANANIYWLGVSPDVQGMRLGTSLINYIENIAINKGIQTLTVETVSPNEKDEHYLKTYDFYQNVGFTPLFTLKPTGYRCEMVYMVKTHLSNKKHKIEKDSQVIILPDSITGESVEEKLNRLLKFLPSESDFLILTSPESICWLLNIRSNDIQYNPILVCYAVVNKSEIILFANIDQQALDVRVKRIDEFKNFLLDNQHQKFAFDRNRSSAWLTQNLQHAIDLPDPVLNMRAIKNNVELSGIKLAHLYDGIAICKFWFWLYFSLKSGVQITEISAAEKLHDSRMMNEFFLYESFPTISAYGSNGAIVHYHPKENNHKMIPSVGCDYIYLLDSGGQYTCAGTTDITRVFDIGKIFGVNKYEHKRSYTLLVKGHINLAKAVFPEGTTGSQLDALTRYYLWQNGLDYGHSTGHGVGHFLSVHEGPHAISMRNNVALEENMILSIEPGYYKEGAFGMRIENLYAVKRSHKFDGFLQFELLTMVPIETSLIDFNLLTEEEIDWLRSHNYNTIETIKNYLSSEEVEFIINHSKVK